MNIVIIPAFFQTKSRKTLGSFFLEQARALQKKGHKVTILYCDTYSIKCVKDWFAYNLSLIHISWKVMKDIIVSQYGIVDFATGSPRDTLKTAYSVGLISDDLWLQMLKVRNTLIHDYDGDVAKRYFKNITEDFFELFQQLRSKACLLYTSRCV